MNRFKPLSELLNFWRRWLRLGIGVKRWLVMLGVGAIIVSVGVGSLLLALPDWSLMSAELYNLVTLQFLPVGVRIILPIVVGGLIIFVALLRLAFNLVAPFRRPDERISDSLYNYSLRNRGPRIVAIGGGTGMPSLLRGLREYTSNITAVVTVADDGGSSGRLRKELGVLPPGDFRNNIAALSRDEALMTQLMQYRFGGTGGNGRSGTKGELQGHAFGNLLLVALTGITGSFDEALLAAGRVLAIRGRVLPSTLANVTLTADIEVGVEAEVQRVVGESFITKAGGRIREVQLIPANVPAYPPVVQAILQADLVVIGPGSLYTSILPNLLVADIASALQQTKAYCVYVCNLATQPGETDNYTVADHVAVISDHVAFGKANNHGLLDAVLANNNLSVAPDAGGGHTIFVKPVTPPDVRMVTADLIDEERPWRHDSQKLAQAIVELFGPANQNAGGIESE